MPLLGLPLVISAFWWIAAPTREGRAVLDRIAGFRQYLSITEGERLDRMTPPKETPELFERYLPYRDRAGGREPLGRPLPGRAGGRRRRQGQPGRSPGIRAAAARGATPSGFVDRVGSSLASTVSSASTAPGSSSGSGGGGSSGGGGGGGGGGGW